MKLYLIVRADLSIAQQAVQAAHALQEFNIQYPHLVEEWHKVSNVLVLLAAADEATLSKLAANIDQNSLAKFHEPDLKGQLTAVATTVANRRLKRLPLALCTKG